jgi:hypothetical protein
VKPKKYYLRKRRVVKVGELMEYNRGAKLAQRIFMHLWNYHNETYLSH